MSVSILLADSNRILRNRFSEALINKRPGEFDIVAVSSAAELDEALAVKQYDVLLLDPVLYAETIQLQNARLVLLLVDEYEMFAVKEALTGFTAIHKYQKVTDMVEIILNQLAALPVKAAEIQTVFSPSGGAGATTVTAALAFQYAKTGKRTMYVNLENINSSPLFFECGGEGSGNASLLFKRRDLNADTVKTFVKKDARSQVLYFPMIDNLYNAIQVTADDIRLFFKTLADSGIADIIIVDVQGIDERTTALFDMAECVLLVTDLSETGLIKLNRLCRMCEPHKSKMKIICNKKPARWKAPDGDIPVLFEIPPFQPASFRELIENICQSGVITI